MVGAEHARFHAHRWITPDNTIFDIVPDHFGGTGSSIDAFALSSAETIRVGTSDEQSIGLRHASAVAFLALKCAAHNDRGRDDPRTSHDLEDIVALLASRPTITEECTTAPEYIRKMLATFSLTIIHDPDRDELIDGHLGLSAMSLESVRRRVVSALKAIAIV